MVEYLSPWVFATTGCNLGCPYCYVKQDGRTITQATLDKIADVFPRLVKNGAVGQVVFRLAGGEPLLNFDAWKDTFAQLVGSAENHCSVGLLTNLTILTPEIVSWAEKYATSGISTSLDGVTMSKPFHGGESSSKVVIGNIETLLARGYGSLHVTTVLSEGNLKELPAIAKLVADWRVGWSINLDHYFNGGLDQSEVLEAMIGAVEILLTGGFDLVHSFKFNNVSLAADYDGCTAGEKLFAIGTNGEIWPCQTLSDQPPAGVLDENLLKTLEASSLHHGCGKCFQTPQGCIDCPIVAQCHGGCKLHGKRGEDACKITKSVFYVISQFLI